VTFDSRGQKRCQDPLSLENKKGPDTLFCSTLSNSTLSGNSAAIYGGGIFITGGTATVSTSVFCGNTPDNIDGSYTDGGGNTFC
jgi:hypothetical protein